LQVENLQEVVAKKTVILFKQNALDIVVGATAHDWELASLLDISDGSQRLLTVVLHIEVSDLEVDETVAVVRDSGEVL
jgi:hypothetical protein